MNIPPSLFKTTSKLFLSQCLVLFLAILATYFAQHNTSILDGTSNKTYLSLLIAAPACIYFMYKSGPLPSALAGAILVPSFYAIYFFAACSIYKDCV